MCCSHSLPPRLIYSQHLLSFHSTLGYDGKCRFESSTYIPVQVTSSSSSLLSSPVACFSFQQVQKKYAAPGLDFKYINLVEICADCKVFKDKMFFFFLVTPGHARPVVSLFKKAACEMSVVWRVMLQSPDKRYG